MARTYYEILGVPVGASINHIKDSYRLLTKKTVITDAAYETHTLQRHAGNTTLNLPANSRRWCGSELEDPRKAVY